MSLSPVLHVEFKKCPCHPVDFRGQEPCLWEGGWVVDGLFVGQMVRVRGSGRIGGGDDGGLTNSIRTV